MSKSNHLNRAEVKKTLKNGERFSIKGITAIFLPNNQESSIIVVVSKKVSPSSVNRNTIKRRLREAFRVVFGEKENILLPAVPSFEFLGIKNKELINKTPPPINKPLFIFSYPQKMLFQQQPNHRRQ